MIEKPSRYFVEYPNNELYIKLLKRCGNPDEIDPAEYWEQKDFDDLRLASAWMNGQPMSCQLKERYAFENIGSEIPIWEWKERLIEEN